MLDMNILVTHSFCFNVIVIGYLQGFRIHINRAQTFLIKKESIINHDEYHLLTYLERQC